MSDTKTTTGLTQTLPNGVELVWDDADIMSSYANVATATATKAAPPPTSCAWPSTCTS